MIVPDPLVDPRQRPRRLVAENAAQFHRRLRIVRIGLQDSREPIHRLGAIAHVGSEQRRFHHRPGRLPRIGRQRCFTRQEPHHFLLVAVQLGDVPRAFHRQDRVRIARQRLVVRGAGVVDAALLGEDLRLLQRQRGAGFGVGERAAEGEVLGEQRLLSRRAQRLFHQIEGDAILRVQRQRAAEFGDALVALARRQPILGRFRAQERRHPWILATRREPPAQLGPLAADVGGLVLRDQRQELRHGLEIARRLRDQRAQQRGGPVRLPGAVRVQGRRPAAGLVAVGHRLRRAGELLVRFGGLGVPAGPGEEPRQLRPGECRSRMRLRRRPVQLDRAPRIAHPPLGQLGRAPVGLGARMALRHRFRDLNQYGQRRRVIAAPQLQPRQPPQHSQLDAGQRQRLCARLDGLVDAALDLQHRRALGVQRRGPFRRRLSRLFEQ